MKNIHVLQTDKPSRLYRVLEGYLKFETKETNYRYTQNQNIYITSDEEIKEGDYRYNSLHPNEGIFKVENQEDLNYVLRRKQYKKIILTTDQDLIKDGVQSIDDTFLEWFVKNPSCEEVEVLRCPIEGLYTIIPKEEPKQEYEYIGECKSNDGNGCFMDSCGHDCGCFVRIPKQETLEEVAERIYQEEFNNPYLEEIRRKNIKDAMIKLAKWQQKQCEKELDAHLEVAEDLWLQVVKQNKKLYNEEELKIWLVHRDLYLYNYYTTYIKSEIPLESVEDFIKENHEYLMDRKLTKSE